MEIPAIETCPINESHEPIHHVAGAMAIGMVVTDDKPLSFIAQFQYMLFHWRIRYCFDSPFFESTQAPGKTGFGGLSHTAVGRHQVEQLQKNIIFPMPTPLVNRLLKRPLGPSCC